MGKMTCYYIPFPSENTKRGISGQLEICCFFPSADSGYATCYTNGHVFFRAFKKVYRYGFVVDDNMIPTLPETYLEAK